MRELIVRDSFRIKVLKSGFKILDVVLREDYGGYTTQIVVMNGEGMLIRVDFMGISDGCEVPKGYEYIGHTQYEEGTCRELWFYKELR